MQGLGKTERGEQGRDIDLASMRSTMPASGPLQGVSTPTLNMNLYATKKTAAEGMLDIALFLANITHMKTVIEQGAGYRYSAVLCCCPDAHILLPGSSDSCRRFDYHNRPSGSEQLYSAKTSGLLEQHNNHHSLHHNSPQLLRQHVWHAADWILPMANDAHSLMHTSALQKLMTFFLFLQIGNFAL
ncbi:uncharacterized protein LOC102217440 isoform X1 [Xiphophorus maculatus]|uniref:uncharacterized protein LOC102217440 isoform X1 n=1 Tax=Xiphophorus maculatus TaxID=8083 RepID=UPI000C6DA1F7|nr:uncharacterized protein LOC102217440 isoform X1 [Xiphophorus maculatus]